MNKVKEFYSSIQWQNCRDSYKKSVGGLCEECLKHGIVSPAEEVHHRIRLTEFNVDDPSISLNPKNLEAVCSKCHEAKHKKARDNRRYTIDEYGRVTPKRYTIDENGKLIPIPE